MHAPHPTPAQAQLIPADDVLRSRPLQATRKGQRDDALAVAFFGESTVAWCARGSMLGLWCGFLVPCPDM